MARIFYAAALIGVLVGAHQPARAGLVLTYDDPVIDLMQGASVEITATLSLVAGSGPTTFQTDSKGALIPSDPPGFPVYFPSGQEAIFCEPYFGQPTDDCAPTFTPTLPTPLANLDLVDGSSVDLDLGVLTAGALLPVGSYAADIGIGEANEVCGKVCEITIDFSVIDAGPLEVDVMAVPEPSAMAVFGSALIGLMMIKLGRRPARLA
jgi:PEP-CTERM motif